MGQEKLGCVDEAAVKAVGLFGGGISKSGHTCGALLGGVAAFSSAYSRGTLEGKEDPVMWELGKKLVGKFEQMTEQHGGIRCSDIARVEWENPESVQEFRTNPESRRKYCREVVGETAQAIGELVDEGAQR